MRWLLSIVSAERSTNNDDNRSSPCSGTPNTTDSSPTFHRRGRTAVRMEWRVLMLTHDLTKLHSATRSPSKGSEQPPDRTGSRRPSPPAHAPNIARAQTPPALCDNLRAKRFYRCDPDLV